MTCLHLRLVAVLDKPIIFQLSLVVAWRHNRYTYKVFPPALEELGLTISDDKKLIEVSGTPQQTTRRRQGREPPQAVLLFQQWSGWGQQSPGRSHYPTKRWGWDQENQLQSIAEPIPTLDRIVTLSPYTQFPSISAAMSQTATVTQTHPTALLGRIYQSDLPFSGGGGGNCPGRGFPPPAPGGGSRGGGGGGSGPGRGGNPHESQLVGKEPAVFNGDWSKAWKFAQEWIIYTGLNVFNFTISTHTLRLC